MVTHFSSFEMQCYNFCLVLDHFSLLCWATWLPLVHRYDVTLRWNLTGISLNTLSNFEIERKKKKQGLYFFYETLRNVYPKVRKKKIIYNVCHKNATIGKYIYLFMDR